MNYFEDFRQAQADWRAASARLGGLWGNPPESATRFEDTDEATELRDKIGVQHLRQAAAKMSIDAWKTRPRWQRKVCALRYYTLKGKRPAA